MALRLFFCNYSSDTIDRNEREAVAQKKNLKGTQKLWEINGMGRLSHSYPMKLILSCFLSCVSFLTVVPSELQAKAVRTNHAVLELVSERTGLVPGKPNTVAIRFELEEGWHTYWANPGDTGLPTEITWELPRGIEAGGIQWPAPLWIEYFDLVSYGYEEEVLLLVDLEVDDSLAVGQSVDLAADVDFLVCKEACIPGSAKLKLNLPVSQAPQPSSWKSAFDATRNRLPRTLPDYRLGVVDNGQSFALTVIAPEGVRLEDREITFFSQDGWVAASEPRTSLAEGRVLTQVLPKSALEPESDRNRFRGILVSDVPWDDQNPSPSLAVDLPFTDSLTVSGWVSGIEGSAALGPGGGGVAAGGPAIGFSTALWFAFLGGMLLNLMPCVFPVLSIKVLGFVQQAGEEASKVKRHGLVFTLGVLLSFWLLAGLLLILRAAGEEIGWGFQLQSPGFVAVLASVLFLFGLNLSGVFEVGESLTGAGARLQAKSGYSGSFFSGVLATLVATPCTAPLMGTALGAVIFMPAYQSMLVFTSLALGMAFPYLLLSFFPALLKYLPRPGAWMESFKKGLAFLLYASVVWLAWVFGKQVGVTGMAGLLLGILIMGAAAWIRGSWGAFYRSKTSRRWASSIALLFLVAGGYLQYLSAQFAVDEVEAASKDASGIAWSNYSPAAVDGALKEGRTVFVDFTATWCLTCQVNKKVAFTSDEVIRFFEENAILPLKGDWTKRDPAITRELQKFGRNGVPTNIIYWPDGTTRLLPEVLTPRIVLNAFEKDA